MTPEYELPDKYMDVVGLKPGKNGDVFRARHALVGRDVFLKVYGVPKEDPLSALREPYTLTSLSNKHLVGVHGADVIEGTDLLLLEMEFVSGGSLESLVERATSTGEWPSVHSVISLAMGICQGLSHLHAKGYVHRDLKPANVMLRDGPTGQEAVVADLGLASKLNDTGRAFASQHARLYRPPEVWLDQGYSHASDVYQVGIVLYQLLGGTIKYALGSMPDAVLKKRVVSGDLLDWATLGLHVPRRLNDLLRECVALEAKRLPTAAALIARLHECRAQCRDWSMKRGANTCVLSAQSEGRGFQVYVKSQGDSHEVSVKKRIAAGRWRNSGKSMTIEHSSLRSSRVFQRTLEGCK